MADHIGERIRKIRQDRGFSLSELADTAEVAKSYLSNVERGIQSNPSISFLQKVSDALNVSINLLLYGDRPSDSNLDPEWASLVQEAMSSGISKKEFWDFLEYQKWKLGQKD